jgi:hypothetical protein
VTYVNARILQRLGLSQAATDTLVNLNRDAQNAAIYAVANPSSALWRSDTSGVFPASDPTADLVMTFYGADGVAVAVRTLRGTLTSSTGNISVTNVSSTGLATTYVLYGNASTSVRADIALDMGNGRITEASVSWASFDNSVAGATPDTIDGGSGGGGGGGGAK